MFQYFCQCCDYTVAWEAHTIALTWHDPEYQHVGAVFPQVTLEMWLRYTLNNSVEFLSAVEI